MRPYVRLLHLRPGIRTSRWRFGPVCVTSQTMSKGGPICLWRPTSPCTSTRTEVRYLSKHKGSDMDQKRFELPQGTLDLLILKTLAIQPLHGWAISERLHQVSAAALQIGQGSLYPALHRLERRGWIKGKWGASDNNRRAKYYELTRTGRRQLEIDAEEWRRLTVVVSQVLDMA